MLKKVAVVIPFYQESVSEYESIALAQCKKVLAAYPIIAVKPQSLTLPQTTNPAMFTEIISFDDHFFAGIAGYNHLMLSHEFYERFTAYEYILIYQLDAFVFSDQLTYWCNQDIDYVGAPWIKKFGRQNWLKQLTAKLQQTISTKLNLKKKGLPNKYQFEWKVGNGGLSLRRVKKFYELSLAMPSQINFYLSHQAHQYNEDAFWSIEVNRKTKVLNIPNWQAGLRFAFETHPEHAYHLNDNQLPFGCHDWDSYLDFWRPFFKNQGFDI
ncbi:DUF5672 family protein [Mucilaginibacter lacusdianchii]|uniref:DUF5672 family protein n=1 Tax=Mucilaginibacter lacusdianchii TaxID=2684211 RepID=UPI00131AD563|nr:DUF5672 family protein [Mucilaginibacter sp. JXJ CY 39]